MSSVSGFRVLPPTVNRRLFVILRNPDTRLNARSEQSLAKTRNTKEVTTWHITAS